MFATDTAIAVSTVPGHQDFKSGWCAFWQSLWTNVQLSFSLLMQTREEGLLATKSHDWLIRRLISITGRPCEISPAFVTPLHAQHVTVLSWKVSPLYQHHGSLSLKSRSYFPAQGTQFSSLTGMLQKHTWLSLRVHHCRGHRLDIHPLILFRLQHSLHFF